MGGARAPILLGALIFEIASLGREGGWWLLTSACGEQSRIEYRPVKCTGRERNCVRLMFPHLLALYLQFD